MPRYLVALFAVTAALVLAPPAFAVDPLTVTSSTPADRALVPPTPTGGISWTVRLAGVPDDANVSVTVRSDPTTGDDGVTLAAQGRDDFFFVTPTGAPVTFFGRSDPGPNAWSAVAGTYYWQILATWTDASMVFHSAAGPIERVFIGTTLPPGAAGTGPGTPGAPGTANGAGRPGVRPTSGMTSLDPPYYIRKLIRGHTKRKPVRLRYGCARRNVRSFRCRPTWRDSRNVYSATATFTHTRSGGKVVARATVTGVRASRQCTRTRSLKACGRSFHWRSTIASRPLGKTR
jgi:hypothetical protein